MTIIENDGFLPAHPFLFNEQAAKPYFDLTYFLDLAPPKSTKVELFKKRPLHDDNQKTPGHHEWGHRALRHAHQVSFLPDIRQKG